MTTFTMELPETLMRQVRERQLSEKEIKSVLLAALEIWLAQRDSKNGENSTESAGPFIRQLIAQNRELFETLAQR